MNQGPNLKPRKPLEPRELGQVRKNHNDEPPEDL